MSSDRDSPPRHRSARRLDGLATLLVAVLPLAAWVQSRSAAAALTAACLATLAARLADGSLHAAARRMLTAFWTGPGVLLALFMLWAATTLLWSHRPAAGLRDWGEMLLPLVAGFVLAMNWPAHAPRWAMRAIGTGVLLACLLTFLELWQGTWVRASLGLRPHSYIFNRTVICLALLIVPVSVVFLVPARLWPEAAPERRRMIGGMLVAFAAFAGCLATTESGAVRLGALVGLAVAALALVLPRLAMVAMAAGLVALVAIAPWQGEVLDRLIPASAHEAMKDSHSRDRLDIWLAFGELGRKRPLTGAGFGAGDSASTHPVAQDIEGRRRVLLDVGHPHSLQVQAFAETGLVGAVLLALAGLAALGRLRHWPHRLRAMALGTAAGALAIGGVGHGAWQGWWIAALAVSCALFALARRLHDADLNPAAAFAASKDTSA